jgi:hypothetical protein
MWDYSVAVCFKAVVFNLEYAYSREYEETSLWVRQNILRGMKN